MSAHPAVEKAPAYADSAFMRACRGLPNARTPVWLMRQAGRYMREYRAVREKVSFVELCRTPDLAAEVAVTALDAIGADAAILFSDILLILQPMGMDLEYLEGGPVLHNPVRSAADVERLREAEPRESLAFVYEAVRRTREQMNPALPLIGFCGAPFTLASYMIEGGGSRHFENTKRFMYADSGAWHALMEKLVRGLTVYLNEQIRAGAQAGADFRQLGGLPLSRGFQGVRPAAQPRADCGESSRARPSSTSAREPRPIWKPSPERAATWSEWISAWCWADARERLGDLGIQGNLDPCVLFAQPERILERAEDILRQGAARPGHIFNLGHGILPGTPVDNVKRLIEFVQEWEAGAE